MTYQDYLPDTPYTELPAAIRATVSRAEYETLQEMTAAMAAPPELPPALRAAYRARVVVAPVAAKASIFWRVAALLGWGLLAIGAIWWLRQVPERVIEYRTLPAPPPEVVVRYDTVTVEQVRRVDRVRLVRDTVYVERAPAPVVDRASAPAPHPLSRSVADGPDWRALTVGGSVLSESE